MLEADPKIRITSENLYQSLIKEKSQRAATATGAKDTLRRELKHQNDLDKNGLLYYIGTNERKTDYVNPQLSNLITVTTSSLEGKVCPENFVERGGTESWIASNRPGQWVRFDLKSYKLKKTHTLHYTGFYWSKSTFAKLGIRRE